MVALSLDPKCCLVIGFSTSSGDRGQHLRDKKALVRSTRLGPWSGARSEMLRRKRSQRAVGQQPPRTASGPSQCCVVWPAYAVNLMTAMAWFQCAGATPQGQFQIFTPFSIGALNM